MVELRHHPRLVAHRLTGDLLHALAIPANLNAMTSSGYRVLECYLHSAPGAASQSVSALDITPEGIVGHAHQNGTVTLIEQAAVDASELYAIHRRNLVVDALPPPGCRLIFPSGLMLDAWEYCEPCQRLVDVLGLDGIPRALVHTGLRARIIEPGQVAQGDKFTCEPSRSR